MNYSMVDSTNNDGFRITYLIGTGYEHYKNGYWTILGAIWDGDSDTWLVAHTNKDHVIVTRTWDNFFGKLETGGFRFRQII